MSLRCAALSHRWGSAELVRTAYSNLDKYKRQSIQVYVVEDNGDFDNEEKAGNSLPPTFRETVELCCDL